MATVPAPPTPFYVKAISAYTARNNTEMSLEVGKVYNVCHTDGRGLWWQSKSEETGAAGWFPASYTQVIEAPAPAQTAAPAYQAAPVEQQQQTQATPAATQPQVAAQPAVQSNHQAASSIPSDRGAAVKSSVETGFYGNKVIPPNACTITLHVVEAKDLTGVPPAKMTPSVYIYRRDVTEKNFKNIKPLFNAVSKTKTNAPRWNEEFKIYIKDCEMEIVGLRFAAKADFKAKGKDHIGDLEFPLRAAVRKFDKPNGSFQWHTIKNTDGAKTGEVLLFVEYADPRSFGGPTNVEHKGHVGITVGGGFEIRDIPQEWKQLFRVLNIKKKDLENNPEMAKEVFDIMKNADLNNIPGSNATASEPAVTNNNHTAPQVSHAQPVHHQQESTHTPSVPAPPPVPSGANAGPKPPAPPPPPPANAGPKPPTPPVVVETQQSSLPPSNGGSMFDQLKNVKLKKAEVAEDKGPASTGNALADTLLSAMSKYRVDIAGKDADDGDDWSEE